MSTRCITPYCHNSTIINPTRTRTPGFFPTHECLTCGARWIDRTLDGRVTLYELNSAVKEYRSSVGDGVVPKVARAGRREP
jgi:hypothetical protein